MKWRNKTFLSRRHSYIITLFDEKQFLRRADFWTQWRIYASVNYLDLFSGAMSKYVLTHWGRVTHICVSKLTIIGSDNGLSPGGRQAIQSETMLDYC